MRVTGQTFLILDGGLPVVIDALKDIDTTASFDYNPSNGFPFLTVNHAYGERTEDILREEGFISRNETQWIFR